MLVLELNLSPKIKNKIKKGKIGAYLVDILFYLWYIENEPTNDLSVTYQMKRASNPLKLMEVRKDSDNYLKYKKENWIIRN